jgi:hypothetical protein
MGLFTTTVTKDTRWNVAVHEAGHVIVGRRLGARGLHASITTDRRGRSQGQCTPRRFAGATTELDFAAYCLAGAVAGRLITGDEALVGSDDLDAAHDALAGTGHSLRDAERHATRLVRRHRDAIERAARQLYDHGRI